MRDFAMPTKKAKSRGHVFRGEDLAGPLLTWLNSRRNTEGRIESLLDAYRRRRALTSENEIRAWETEVDGILGYYRLLPVIIGTNANQWLIDWRSTRKDSQSPESAALLKLLTLASQGLLANVRRCERPDCGTWFYQRFVHQKYHTEKCKFAVLAADPARKEKRREYMRDLRKLKKRLRNARKKTQKRR
jgi:hypothetical protein